MTRGNSGTVRRGTEQVTREEGEVNNLPRPPAVGGTEEEDGDAGNREEAGHSQVHTVAALCEYFQSMNEGAATFTTERKDALAIILDRLNESDDATTGLPQDFFSNSHSSPIRKEMLSLLSGRIPEAKRQRRLGDATLKKWFLAANSIRMYMFYTKDALIEIAASTGAGVRLASNLSFEAMISKLVNATTPAVARAVDIQAVAPPPGGQNNCPEQLAPPPAGPDEMNITQEIIKALLSKSFMKPLKGAIRDYCSMGHKLELPLAKDWMADVNEKNLFPGFKIISLHKVGIVGKKYHPWAKDSIDFIAFAFCEDTDCLELWGVEIKSRQTNTTIISEKEHSKKLRRKKHIQIDADKVHKFIPKLDERFQLLHHAYVYGFERVVLVVGTKEGKVLNGTVVNYNNSIHQSYGKVVDELKNRALLWAYQSTVEVIPNQILRVAYNVPLINGKEPFYGTLKLWKTMFGDQTVLPRPALQQIIPTTHVQWNTTKGGSDTIIKLVDDCYIHPPKIYTCHSKGTTNHNI